MLEVRAWLPPPAGPKTDSGFTCAMSPPCLLQLNPIQPGPSNLGSIYGYRTLQREHHRSAVHAWPFWPLPKHDCPMLLEPVVTPLVATPPPASPINQLPAGQPSHLPLPPPAPPPLAACRHQQQPAQQQPVDGPGRPEQPPQDPADPGGRRARAARLLSQHGPHRATGQHEPGRRLPVASRARRRRVSSSSSGRRGG